MIVVLLTYCLFTKLSFIDKNFSVDAKSSFFHIVIIWGEIKYFVVVVVVVVVFSYSSWQCTYLRDEKGQQ